MPQRYRCVLLLLIFSTLPSTASAWDFWDICHCLNPLGWLSVTGTGPHANDGDEPYELLLHEQEDDSHLQETDLHEPTCPDESAQPVHGINNIDARLWFESLEPALGAKLLKRGITPERLEQVLLRNRNIVNDIDRLMLEILNYRNPRNLQHHSVLRFIIRMTCLMGGAINRIVLPHGIPLGVAVFFSAGAFISSNIVSLSGANQLQFQGFHSLADGAVFTVAGTSVLIDDGMTFHNFQNFFKDTDVESEFLVDLLSFASLYFMTVGLGPILMYKIKVFAQKFTGQNPDLATLNGQMANLFADIILEMERGRLTIKSSLQARITAYDNLLGWGPDASTLIKFLDACCLYGPYSLRKNTITMACEYGFNNPALCNNRWCMLERIDHEEQQSRAARKQRICDTTLFMICLIPGLAYGFGDSNSASLLLQNLTGRELGCENGAESADSLATQLGLLALMLGKSLTATQCGVENLQRIARWGWGMCLGTNEKLSKKQKAVNLLALCVGLVYGGNTFINLYGNILQQDCINQYDFLAWALPVLTCTGGILFNIGCGHALVAFYYYIKDLLVNCRERNPESCANRNLQALLHLIEAEVIEIIGEEGEDPDIKGVLAAQGFEFDERTISRAAALIQAARSQVHIDMTPEMETPLLSPGDSVSTIGSNEEEVSQPLLVNQQEFLRNYQLNVILAGVVQPEDQNKINRRVTPYLNSIAEAMAHHGWAVLISVRGKSGIFEMLAKILSQQYKTGGISAKELQNRVANLLLALLYDNPDSLPPEQKRFLAKIPRWKLHQGLRDLLDEHTNAPVFLQMVALAVNQNIVFVMMENGQPAVNLIEQGQPELIQPLGNLIELHGDQLVLVNNAMGNWAVIGHELHDTEETDGEIIENNFTHQEETDTAMNPVQPAVNEQQLPEAQENDLLPSLPALIAPAVLLMQQSAANN